MPWLLLLARVALAHPGADAHAHHGCDDLPGVLRYADALTEEGRYPEAQAAIARASACGAAPADTDLASGTLSLAAGRPAEALPALDRAVRLRPGPPTLVPRARALDALGRPEEAAADWLAAIVQSPSASPDLWLGAARSLVAAGRPEEALGVVDRGLAALGPVASLVREGVTLTADPDAALRRLEGQPDTPAWLQLRGDVLARAGRVEAAREAYARALDALRRARPSAHAEAQLATLRSTLSELESR